MPVLSAGEHRKILRRALSDQIAKGGRLIGIKGFRGSGKTTFLLDYIRSHSHRDKTVLYASMNNFYFTGQGVFPFAMEFAKMGGRLLLLDQIQKFPGWQEELRRCYNQIPGLTIIFTVSPSAMTGSEVSGIGDIARIYSLEGLSFREYLNFTCETGYDPVALEELLHDHGRLAEEITAKTRVLPLFGEYLRQGYFPYFAEKGDLYQDILLKNINLTLEIDIPYSNQIDLGYLPKLRKLLYLVATETPLSPNVSKLAMEVGTSRATVMHYLQHLAEARLVRLLYADGDAGPGRKPGRIYLHNTNLLHSVAPGHTNGSVPAGTFFYSQAAVVTPDIVADGEAGFLVDGRHRILAGGSGTLLKPEQWGAIDGIETGKDSRIPLWLFGFLY